MSNLSDDMEPDWSLAQWEDGELVFWTRWRADVTVADPARPVRILIKLGYESDRPDGLPEQDAIDRFDEIEAELARDLAEHNAEIVLVLTGKNAREFIAYGDSFDFLEGYGPTVFERWPEAGTGREVDAQPDPSWELFRRFTP